MVAFHTLFIVSCASEAISFSAFAPKLRRMDRDICELVAQALRLLGGHDAR